MTKIQRILTSVFAVLFMGAVFLAFRANAKDHCLPGKECKDHSAAASCCTSAEKK